MSEEDENTEQGETEEPEKISDYTGTVRRDNREQKKDFPAQLFEQRSSADANQPT